jgi:hypothetical protein
MTMKVLFENINAFCQFNYIALLSMTMKLLFENINAFVNSIPRRSLR